MKILKSKKALSPVVASIILIAVTVAVSIAVAAWMGILTTSRMNYEQFSITNVEFASGNIIYATVNNTGTVPIVINEAWINSVKQLSVVKNGTTDPLPLTINANQGIVLKITYAWLAGYHYQIKVVSAQTNPAVYDTWAPGT